MAKKKSGANKKSFVFTTNIAAMIICSSLTDYASNADQLVFILNDERGIQDSSEQIEGAFD